MAEKTNRLAKEKSPYLLQHSKNPVDWYSWSREAFEKAVEENKPIFLSIGYSTCHWCHVMEKESFEDPEVARLMNETFISVKVDREERPDIDSTYMQVCQMLTGSGGWPLTIFMTPEKKPFFAATYIPREARFGRSGLMDLIPHIKNLWTEKRHDLLASSDQITEALRQVPLQKPGRELDETVLRLTFNQLLRNFDDNHGGFGSAPKFPSPHNLMFLLRNRVRTGNRKALEMVEKTLQEMRRGGIYDHVGSGFHRYSTDERWLVPHFEKMLYDQALMAMAYTETYQETGKKEYAQTTREIFDYVMRNLSSPEGGFYSAEDADSEGKEGEFYVWSLEEVKGVLDKNEFELAKKVFNVKRDGNFTDPLGETGTKNNILHQSRSFSDIAGEMGILTDELIERVTTIRRKLFEYRELREHPHKDDKILTDWNGLMIAALAKASAALEEPGYAKAAGAAVDFIWQRLRTESGRLLHRYRDGDAAITAQLDDYSFLIWGLVELYEATFDEKYLVQAKELNNELLEYFWDLENGGFFQTASDAEKLLIRNKEIYDGAVPSGNSVAFLNLLRLSKLLKEPDLEKKASELNMAFSKQVGNVPRGHTMFLTALDFAKGPSREVVIRGNPESQKTKEMISAIRTHFFPGIVVLLNPGDKQLSFNLPIPDSAAKMDTSAEEAVAYVCTNYSCKEPTSDVGRMLKLLGENARK